MHINFSQIILKICRSFVPLMIATIEVVQANLKPTLPSIWWSYSVVYFQISAAVLVWLWLAVSFGCVYFVWKKFLSLVWIWHVVGCSFRISDSISVCVSVLLVGCVKPNVNALDFYRYLGAYLILLFNLWIYFSLQYLILQGKGINIFAVSPILLVRN